MPEQKREILDVIPVKTVAVAIKIAGKKKPEVRLCFVVGDNPKRRQIVMLPQNLERSLEADIPSTAFQRKIMEKAGMLEPETVEMEDDGDQQL